MKDLREIWNNSNKTARVFFWVLLLVGVGFLIASFILPPTGKIDNSVLTAFGMIQGFASIGVGFSCIEEGMQIKMKHNDTEIELSKNE